MLQFDVTVRIKTASGVSQYQKVRIAASSQIAAKAMAEAQYGRGTVVAVMGRGRSN